MEIVLAPGSSLCWSIYSCQRKQHFQGEELEHDIEQHEMIHQTRFSNDFLELWIVFANKVFA